MSDARDCESYLRQLQETIKRQYTCDKSSRLSKLEDLLQDSMVSAHPPSAAHLSFISLYQLSVFRFRSHAATLCAQSNPTHDKFLRKHSCSGLCMTRPYSNYLAQEQQRPTVAEVLA